MRGADAAGIPFRIIPGITAGIGGLAYAGIPLTSRETNTAVTFIMGHTAAGGIPDDLDWDALSRAAPVLVICMGSRHMAPIRDRLVASGRDPAEPVGIVSAATTPQQKVLTTTLAACAEDLAAAALPAPMLIVVGRVVAYHAAFRWFVP
jgi:uroporphyrin-III C-methyltransferase